MTRVDGGTPLLAFIVGGCLGALVVMAYVVIWKLWQNKKAP